MKESALNAEKAAQKSFGATLHTLFGWSLLFMTLVKEVVWLLPRNPVSFFLGVLPPRTLSLTLLPETYQTIGFSGIFDGSGTVVLQFVALLSMFLAGSYKREILWPYLYRKRVRRVLTAVIFVVNPFSWMVREYLVHQDMSLIAQAVHENLGPTKTGVSSMDAPYRTQDYVSNLYGGKIPLQPNLTVTYKSVPKDEIGCDFHHSPLAIPGDIAMTSILAELWKGNLQLDVYKPMVQKFETAPIVLHIHGGGWKRGHRRFVSFNYHGGLPHYLLSNGYMIVSVSYRLICPPITGHDQIEDIVAAVKFIVQHAKEWGGDADRILPFGTSAGGHLAMLLAYKYQLPQVRGVFNFYGVSELRTEEIRKQATGFWEKYIHAPIFTLAIKKICEGHERLPFDACMADLSPLNFVSKRSPPTITVHTWQDSLVSVQQAISLDKKLKANNVTHIHVGTHGNHDCDVFVSGPCSQAAMFAISRFLETQI